MAAAYIFILALTIIIWEVNSQKCGGSILVNPLRPPLEEESPIFANPLRPSFAKNPSFPKVSLPMANKLPITGMTLSELTTPRFKAPSFSATCVSSESLLPLTVKTNLSSTALDEIDNSQSLLSNSGQDIIIPLSSEKPIKFYGPLNVEMNNLPLIKPNFALPCDTVSNLVDIEPPILPNLIANSNPVSLFNKTPMTNLIPTTRGLKYILDSSNNISPHYKTFQSSQSKPSAESVASATSSISPSLGQSSSSASTINVNSFQPNQVHQSSYSSNIFNCPENDPTCLFTSVPPLAPCDPPALNDADSSSLITSNLASTSAASLMSSGQVNPNIAYPYISNLTPALYQPSTSMQSSSTAFSSGNAQFNPYQLNPFSSDIYGCPEIDPICFHTSVPPLSANLSYQPSVNVAEATSTVSTGPGQASSSSSSSVNVDSYNYGQVNSVLPSSYLSYHRPSSSQSSVNVAEGTTSVASGSTKTSTAFSQINSNLVDPFSSYINGCPKADPTCSYTSVPPLSTAPCYQSSENVAKTTSSVSKGPKQALSSSSSSINVDSYNTGQENSVFSSPFLSHSLSSPSQSSVNIAKTTTSSASGLRQGSSSSSAYLSGNSQIAPFSPYIYGCPVSDPTCSHTSTAPFPTTSVAHSLVDVAEKTSSASPSLKQVVLSSSSLNLNPYNTPANSIFFTPYLNYVNPGAVTAPSQSSTSIAKTTNSLVAGLGQASSAASSGNIATGQFRPSSYLLNTIACPDTDPTCSFTSVQPVSADQSSVNGADSYLPNVFGSPVKYSSNVVEDKSSISSSTGQDYSSTSFVNNDEFTSRRDSPSTYNSNVFSCPNTDLTCSFFSVPPVSEVPTYQSSVNVAESSSLTTSDLKSFSSSSFGANQGISNTANPYPINIAGFPDFDPTCSFTAVNPVASNKMNQPSVGISEASSSIASSVARASSSASSISVNSFASEDIDLTPNQSNTYNCPDTDPTCSFTSVPPVSEALPYQSSYLGSRSSSSFVANQDSSNTLNPYSANIAGCLSFDPTCSFTSVKPVPPTAFYQPSVGLAEISSATSSGSGHISPLSSPYLNPSVIEQASPSLSTFSSMPQFVTSTPQSTVSSVETASSISSNSLQTEVTSISTTSSTNLDAPSTNLNNYNINNLPGIYSASSTETSVPKITSSSSVSKTLSATSKTLSAPAAVENHIRLPQNSLTSVVEKTAASSSSPINLLTASSSSSTTTDLTSLADKSVPQLTLNNPLSVVETSESSSAISSPTKVLTDSPSISITSADTTSLVDQSPTLLSGQKTQVTKSTATSLLSTPTFISMPLPSTYPSKLALSMSAPEFNLGINPLTLKVEIPSTIMSSIVTSNVPRAYGPHSIKIPSYIPAQLSCTLRS